MRKWGGGRDREIRAALDVTSGVAQSHTLAEFRLGSN
jgi:hypothetical protein